MCSGVIRSYLLGLNALGGIKPNDPVVGRLEFRSLNEIQPSKNHGCQRGKRQHDGPKAHSQILFHDRPWRDDTPPMNPKCKRMSILWEGGFPENLSFFNNLQKSKTGQSLIIHFMGGHIQLSRAQSAIKTAGLAHLGTCGKRASMSNDRPGC